MKLTNIDKGLPILEHSLDGVDGTSTPTPSLTLDKTATATEGSTELLDAVNQLIDNQIYMFDVTIAFVGVMFGILIVYILKRFMNIFL